MRSEWDKMGNLSKYLIDETQQSAENIDFGGQYRTHDAIVSLGT